MHSADAIVPNPTHLSLESSVGDTGIAHNRATATTHSLPNSCASEVKMVIWRGGALVVTVGLAICITAAAAIDVETLRSTHWHYYYRFKKKVIHVIYMVITF